MKLKTMLISGCHGDIALSILKIIRLEYSHLKVLGCDIFEDGVGKVYFDSTFTLPRVSDPSYLEVLKQTLKDKKIDILIPGSEPEMRFLKNHVHGNDFHGVKVIMANHQSMEVGFDKLNTYEFLKNSGLPYIKSVPGNEKPDFPFPMIYKPRAGAGSRGISILHTEADLVALGETSPDYIFQEYIGSAEDEYTCCVFSDGNHIRTISVKRTLRHGLTLTAFPVENAQISELLVKLAKAINLKGSINAQLRTDAKGIPRIFEINPRFSSTVYYRQMLGFKDVRWSIEAALGEPLSPYSGYVSKKLYRHFEDAVVDG